MDLLIGTHNAGKFREVSQIVGGVAGVRLISLADLGLHLEVEEPFATFEENAAHKARRYAQATGMPAIADDSGLAVDALDGRPGVYSARYAEGGDDARYRKLLDELIDVPDAERTARFVCVAALAGAPTPDSITTARGEVEGVIAREPQIGAHGFGYDPVFIPQGYRQSFDTMPNDEKHPISHRGRAFAALLPAILAAANAT